jgi:hypothetical protein
MTASDERVLFNIMTETALRRLLGTLYSYIVLYQFAYDVYAVASLVHGVRLMIAFEIDIDGQRETEK